MSRENNVIKNARAARSGKPLLVVAITRRNAMRLACKTHDKRQILRSMGYRFPQIEIWGPDVRVWADGSGEEHHECLGERLCGYKTDPGRIIDPETGDVVDIGRVELRPTDQRGHLRPLYPDEQVMIEDVNRALMAAAVA